MEKIKDTNYNSEQIKRVSTKTVQVQQEEYIKCQKGEEFKVRIIAHAKPKITLEDIMDEIVGINKRLDKHDSEFKKIDDRFARIIDRLDRNGLKP